jgi:hypothetical protein
MTAIQEELPQRKPPAKKNNSVTMSHFVIKKKQVQ